MGSFVTASTDTAGGPYPGYEVCNAVLAAGPPGRERRAATMDHFAAMMEAFLAEARPDRDLGPIAARALVGGAEEVIFGAIERGDSDLPRLAAEIADTQLKLIA